MKCNEDGIRIIKESEGLELKAYRCPAGILTIGYGHTLGVKKDDMITEQQADNLLLQDIQIAENKVKKHIKTYRDLNENQFSALTSFLFNIREVSFSESNTKSLFNAGRFTEGSEALLKWVYAGRKVAKGLEIRRAKEYALFNKPIKSEEVNNG